MIEEQLEAGWEITLPGWVVKPYSWALAILIIIALTVSIILFNKINVEKLNQNGTQPASKIINAK